MHSDNTSGAVAVFRGHLLKMTFLTLLAASLVLVVAVLPAEYGVDPTGLGKRMGLTALASTETDMAMDMDVTPLRQHSGAWRSDTLTVTLSPGQGAELKVVMQMGERFLFHWEAKGGTVSVDMHGQKPDAAEEDFTSFRLGKGETRADGSFEAPFTGIHGWYWENEGAEPVTVTLATQGFYERLFMP
ncbi:MAG: hypothetical protein R3E89_15100 [Thiolinea sp.]